jgi:hypothetical protein
MQKTATGIDYFPEWYWDCCLNVPIWMQTFGAKEQRSFGITSLWRQPAFREETHYQAYLQEEPGTTPNAEFNFLVYHLFLNLFQAIQAAGPDLNPDTVQRGMFTFNWLDRANVWEPLGGYGDYNADAIAPFSFVDTAMAWWWDPSGTPPGGKRGEGCQRVMLEGRRFYAGEWPKTDKYLFRTQDPCTEYPSKIEDPGAGRGF